MISKGRTHPSEARELTDPATGARVRQVTDAPAIHHHPFFFIPAYDWGMRRLVFVSHRTGSAQIFAEERGSGTLVQLTDRDDLGEWSVYPSRNGRWVLFTAGGRGWRLDLDTLREDCIAELGETAAAEGMVGDAMGTTALSWDDRWWAVPVKTPGGFRFFVVDVERGGAQVILEGRSIGHPQFCPDDAGLIHYIAGMNDRTRVIGRDGSADRLVYRRDAQKNEWITHESWIPGTREIAFVDWPHGIRAIHVDTGAERRVCAFNAWHAIANRTGTAMVADTNCPDTGLQLFDPRDGVGAPRRLCNPQSSQMGEHWAGPFPYADGPVKVYAPQHTHAHPSFAPDDSRIVFTSDRTGHAQVYECLLAACRT